MKIDKAPRWHKRRWVALPLIAVVALAIVFSSCTKEPRSQNGLTGKDMDVTLELTPPGAYSPSQSRAMTGMQQGAINRAEVLVFYDNKLLYHRTGTVTNADEVRKRVKVTLITSETDTELFDIMVIGNPPADFAFASYVGKTKAELKAAFNVAMAVKWADTEFIMYGEAIQTLIKPTTNAFKIQMLRSLARIDVGVGTYNELTDSWTGIADFKLAEIRVVNGRNKFAAIPSATIFSETGNIKVSVPTIPAGTAVQGKTAATAAIYSGADISETGISSKSAIFVAEAPNNADRITLIIGGSYQSGAVSYYRVDMCVPKAHTSGYDYLTILRNHIYRISITSVMGAGYSDPQVALSSPPLNITTTLTPIEEGGAGDIIFDNSSYIKTDVKEVLMLSTPDGVKSVDLFNVKAGFAVGTLAQVTGPGIATPIILTNAVSQLISAVIPASATAGEYYTITVGLLTKKIKLVEPKATSIEIDAHFDFLPYKNVASVKILTPQPWITLSQNLTYWPTDQQPTEVAGNAQSKAYINFDENIATSGAPRTAEVLIKRINGNAEKILFTQRNLSGMVLGYFGGVKNDYGYTKQIAVESIEEYNVRTYDDGSVAETITGMPWGFTGVVATSTYDRDFGQKRTIEMAKRTDSGITAPYTIVNTYAARYCYDKNRDTNGNGTIDDSEVVWYLPGLKQMMGVWIAHSAATTPFEESKYWMAMEFNANYSYLTDFSSGYTNSLSTDGYGHKSNKYRVRCIREI